MKFPVLKREIHLRFITRISVIFLLCTVAVTAGTLVLEYRKLGDTLLRAALKESLALSTPFQLSETSHDAAERGSLQMQLGAALEHSSFIQATLFDQTRDQLVSITREGGAPIARKFDSTYGSIEFSDEPAGDTLYTNKRIYSRAVIPIRPVDSDTITGYLSTVSKVSLEDMQAIVQRFIMTTLISVGGVLLCCLLMYPGMIFLVNRIIGNSSELNLASGFLLRTLGSALARVDSGDVRHNHRVLIYAVRLAEQQGLGRAQIRSLIMGAFLHDVGMLSIDGATLAKPGPLDETELKLIRQHPLDGTGRIKKIRWLHPAREVVAAHHEHYDGSGYPSGLAHEKIPFAARIFAIVDAFDSLTSGRPYRGRMEVDEALVVIEQGSGMQFDPVILSAFVEIAPPLHSVLAQMDVKQLDRELDKVLKKYFKS